MLRSLFAGVSGLRNQQTRMDVIGNNIANVNTVAFKSGRVTFKEGFAQLLQGASRPPGDQGGINPVQIGLGSQIGSIDQLYTQGNLESTGSATDLALQGDSMFVVRKGDQSFYTRSGNFQLDADGKLVSPTNGFVVQGQMYENGSPRDGIEDIKLPFGQKVQAQPSTRVVLGGNVNAGAPVALPGFDIASASDRAAQPGAWTETSITAFDSLGTQHDLKIQLWKTGANQWSWRLDPNTPVVEASATLGAATATGAHPFTLPAAAPGSVITIAGVTTTSGLVIDPAHVTANPGGGWLVDDSVNLAAGEVLQVSYSILPAPPAGTAADPVDPAHPETWNGVNGGVITFDEQGNLDATRTDRPTLSFAVPGADDVSIAINLGNGPSGFTQYATSSSAGLRDQDGFTAGTLQNFSVDRSGTITGYFTNGTTSSLGRIVLADFNNPSGLMRTGDNMYQASANSGSAVLGFALEGSQSQITAGALEMSNVDLAQEFTSMIIAQRAFQANGKVISTGDEMLQELMQIKR